MILSDKKRQRGQVICGRANLLVSRLGIHLRFDQLRKTDAFNLTRTPGVDRTELFRSTFGGLGIGFEYLS